MNSNIFYFFWSDSSPVDFLIVKLYEYLILVLFLNSISPLSLVNLGEYSINQTLNTFIYTIINIRVNTIYSILIILTYLVFLLLILI